MYGFTLIELLVVISIIALLLSILVPSLSMAREQAKRVVCQSDLKQWGLAFDMFAYDNNRLFMKGWDGTGEKTQLKDQWFHALNPYYDEDVSLRLCPKATKPATEAGGVGRHWPMSPTMAWGTFQGSTGWAIAPEDCGSYGINAWVYNPDSPPSIFPSLENARWRTPDVKGAHNVPLLFDAIWLEVWADSTDGAPSTPEVAFLNSQKEPGMCRVCVIRHPGGINMLFLDYHVSKSSLRDLWFYEWHRKYHITWAPPFENWMP